MVIAERTGGDFGTMIKRAREARGVSLRQIAAATKISVAALEALERNDISRLPGGIFGRAFVRSYAIEVGLDPEQTVRDFIAQFPHDSVTAGSPHVPHEDHEAVESTRQSAETAVRLIAISIPIAAAILYFTLRSQPPFTLELQATRPVTLDVEIDGVRREARVVATGERLVLRPGREISIGMSDAGAVELTINGQPAVPLGASGGPGSVRIGRDNYHSFLPSR